VSVGQNDVDRVVRDVERRIRRSYGLRGPLKAQLARLGPRLPPALRREAEELLAARHLAGHPKLARQVDGVRIRRAHDRLTRHLRRVDTSDRRRAGLTRWLGTLAFNLLAVLALAIGVLAWRGVI